MEIIHFTPSLLRLHAEETNNRKLSNFCELFKIGGPDTCVIDRLNGVLETPFKIKSLYEIPRKENYIDISYDDACIQRAIEILKRYNNIVVFYSGGLDSTAVMLSFHTAIINGNGSFEQITVAATPHSIIENPEFWVKFILPNYKLISANNEMDNMGDPSKIADRYVLGENADQLFGSDILNSNFHLFNKSVSEDNIINFLDSRRISEYAKPQMLKVFLGLQNSCPIPLEKMSDLISWWNFSCKWQPVALRLLCYTNFLNVITEEAELERFETFFNTPVFQGLSLFGNLEKWGNPPAQCNYKMASRRFIKRYSGLDDYANNKIKVPSLYRVWVSTNRKYSALGIEDGKIYKLDNISIEE